MGQYYFPILLDKTKTRPLFYAYSHDFGNGLKLMEHSWMKNDFVRFIEHLLMQQPFNLAWCGDYAEGEKLTETELKKYSQKNNDYMSVDVLREKGLNLQDLCDYVGTKLIHNKERDVKPSDSRGIAPLTAKYLINYDKKEFCDKSKIPNVDGCQVHPLPLLTAEGNGQGGGDYFSDNGIEFVGTWARDLIGVSTKKSDIPKDFVEIFPNFKE